MTQGNGLIFVDAHAHIHDCFDLEKFFDSAYGNFAFMAKKIGAMSAFSGILLMAEGAGNRWFDHLENHADGQPLPLNKRTGRWVIRRMPDKSCRALQCDNTEGKKLILMAGQQLRSSEGLEVLALVSRKRFDDGLPIASLIQQITKTDALPVIPWGFGKWLGNRGRVLNKMLSETRQRPFLLGDNQQRPSLFKKPSQFHLALKSGCRILPGGVFPP